MATSTFDFSQYSPNGYLQSVATGGWRNGNIYVSLSQDNSVSIGNLVEGYIGSSLTFNSSYDSGSTQAVFDSDTGNVVNNISSSPFMFSGREISLTISPFLWIPNTDDNAKYFVQQISTYVNQGTHATSTYYREGAYVGVGITTSIPSLSNASFTTTSSTFNNSWPGSYIGSIQSDTSRSAVTFGNEIDGTGADIGSAAAYYYNNSTDDSALYPFVDAWSTEMSQLEQVFGYTFDEYDIILPATTLFGNVFNFSWNNISSASVNKVYIVVKTYIYILPDAVNGTTNYHYGAYEVWGPIYFIRIPSSMLINTSPILSISSSTITFPTIPVRAGMTTISYTPNINSSLFTITYNTTVSTSSDNAVVSLYPAMLNIGSDFMSTRLGTLEYSYSSSTSGTNIQCLEKVKFNIKCCSNSIDIDGSTADITRTNNGYSSSYRQAANYDVTVYNAYAIYVYTESQVSVSGSNASISSSANPYVLNTNAGIDAQSCSGIPITNGANKIYIREVLEEDGIIFDYNSDSNDSANAISIDSKSPTISNDSITSYTITSSSITPSSAGASNTLIGNSSLSSLRITPRLYEISFNASNLSSGDTASIVLDSSAYNSAGSSNHATLNFAFSGSPSSNVEVSWCNNNSSSSTSSGYTSFGNIIGGTTSYSANVTANSRTTYLHIKVKNNDSTSTVDNYNYSFLIAVFGQNAATINMISPSTSAGSSTLNTNGEEYIVEVIWNSGDHVNFTFTYDNTAYTFDFTYNPVSINSITIKDSNNSTITSTDLWLVPNEYCSTIVWDADVWNKSSKKIKFIFDPSTSANSFYFDTVYSSSLTNIFCFTELPYNGSTPGSQYALYPFDESDITYDFANDKESYVDPEGSMRYDCDGNPETLIYPIPGAYERTNVNSYYDVIFASGSATKSFRVNIKRPTIDLTISSISQTGVSSGTTFNAGSNIVISLSKNGDESWSDLFADTSRITPKSGSPAFPANTTISVVNNEVRILFPNSMTSSWTGKITIIGENYYEQPIIVETDEITVNPINVEDIRVYYNNSVKAYTGHPGDLGTIWFGSNDTLTLSGKVYPTDLPSSIRDNILWSVSAASGSSKLSAPSGTTASDVDATFTWSNEKTGGVVHTITASVGGVEAELTITPKKKSTQIIAEDASVEENSYITISIGVDGDESVTSSNTTVTCSSFPGTIGNVSNGTCTITTNFQQANTTDYTFTINFQDSASGVTLSKTVTISVYPKASTYHIYTDFYNGGSGTDTTQIIYANAADGESQIVAVDVSAGSRVTKYNVSADSGLLVSTNGLSSWSSSLSNISKSVSRIYIKQDTSVAVASNTFSRGVRFTAVEHDSAGSSDSETKTIKRGRITFSQAVTNPNRPSHNDKMFKEDTATFTVVLIPRLSTSYNSGVWSNSYGLDYSVNTPTHTGTAGAYNSTTTITCDATGLNNGAYTGSIRYYYPELSTNSTVITNTYYPFEIDILGQTSVCNTLALDPSTQQIMSLAESEASVGYAYTKGSSISTINTVSLASTSTTGYSHNNKLALSYTQTGVTVTSTGIPDDSHDGAIYNISISATNELDETITASGNVIWRIGVDGLMFVPDAYTKSVYGNTGNSIVYNITCKHNYAGSEVNDDFYFNSACNSTTTSGSWWSAVIDNEDDTVTVTTTSKNYDTNDKTVDITLYSKHGLAQFENDPQTCSITFVQNPLVIETTFDIAKADGDSTTTITTNPNTITSSFLTVGQTKTFTITCSHIERETSGGQSIGSFEGETVALTNKFDGGFNTPTLNGNILTISAPDNTTGTYPNSGRTCTFDITTSHGASNRTESYAVTATQPGYQYGNSTILINGNTSDVSDECSSKQQTITYSVACTYDKFVDGYRSATLDGTWTAAKSSSSETWYTISKSGNTLNIEVEQNPNDESRTLIIDITGSFDNTTGLENITRTLSIIQSGSRLEFNPARIENISVDGSTDISTDVETNTSWSISDSSSWITNISPTGDSTDPYDASMTFDVEDNYNPNALTDYVKYRSSTSNRNGGISVDTSSGISVHLPVSQQGYTFDASMSYKLNGVSVTSIEIGPDTSTATLEITSNYDYTLSCSVDWVSFGGNQNNKFNDNDGNTFKTNTYVLTFKYNTSDARNTDITISQVRHQANNGEDSVSSKSLTVSQGTAVGHYALSLSENSLRYDAFGTEEVLTKTIDVTSKLGGWTMDADTIQRNNNSENWFHINQTSYTFIDTADTPVQTTTISIRVNPNPDVDNGHSHTITFTHSQSGSTATLTITQDQATVYFVYVETGTNESENEALTRLKELVEFVKDGVDVGIAMAPPPRSIAVTTGGNDAVNKTYYLYYFYGSSPDKNISYSTTNGAMMSAVPTPKNVPVEVGWSDANSSSSNVYIINVSVNENNTTENRDGIITISGNAAPAVAKIEFTGHQDKRIYQTDLTFAYESGVSYLGDLIGDKWEIPVYGKSYIMKVANKLEYDKLIITNIKISDESSLNPDLSEPIDTSDWATFDYSTSSDANASWTPFVFGNDIIIDKSSNLYIKANIANYQLNENGENRTYENDINVKNYSVQIFVLTESERDNGRQDSSMYYFVNGSGNRFVASQFSKDMFQESWQLLSSEFDVDSNTGSQKVYFRADFNNESINKVLYSEDTGYTLMGSSDTVKNKEIDVLQTILTSNDEVNIAYDVRFGVRLKDN